MPSVFYFIGVSTAGSLSLELFPVWLATLGLPAAEIRGYDLPLRGPREAYREAVRRIRAEPEAAGALVTAHKLDLAAAAGDMFDSLDPDARLFREVSCIAKRGGRLYGSAKDPRSSALALAHFLPPGYWKEHPQAQALILGAGGAGLALSACLLRDEHGHGVPSLITLADLDPRNLEACRQVHAALPRSTALRYRESGAELANDLLLEELPAGSLVVNATGLGKDRPGSPISERARFPMDGLVWEFNYRGALEFLGQARRQQAGRRLTLEDGLVYFIFGWALAIEEVFGRKLSPQDLSALCRATYAYLGSPPDRRPCG